MTKKALYRCPNEQIVLLCTDIYLAEKKKQPISQKTEKLCESLELLKSTLKTFYDEPNTTGRIIGWTEATYGEPRKLTTEEYLERGGYDSADFYYVTDCISPSSPIYETNPNKGILFQKILNAKSKFIETYRDYKTW
ncbi:MAG: hypothetical protein H7843_07405 [Nitrospirota bacterium]